MDAPQGKFYRTHETELWILFDCRESGGRTRLNRERRAWGASATLENLGHGCAVLVSPGGARRLPA